MSSTGARWRRGCSGREDQVTSKSKIDRLGDRLRDGESTVDDLRLLDSYRESFAEGYDSIVATIRSETSLAPTGRPRKTTESIVDKLRRESIRLSQVQDIAGCRLVVGNMLTQDEVVARLGAILDRPVMVDRRQKPSHGYRAVHVIPTANGKAVEIQVRTTLQHRWAQLSEHLSDVFDPSIKYGGGDDSQRTGLANLSALVAEIEKYDGRSPAAKAQTLSAEVDGVPVIGSIDSMRMNLEAQLDLLTAALAAAKGGIRAIPD